jgi:signal transduction histidine kinase
VRQAQKLEAVGRLAAGVVHEIHAPIQFVNDGVHFLSGATHDLMGLLQTHRQAMCSILEGGPVTKLAAQAAKAEAAADLGYLLENVPKAFENCSEGLKRVSTIVRSMKEFSHPDPRERTLVDLNATVQSTLAIAVNEYKYVADLTTDFGTLPHVLCFASDISRVVMNLVINAAHAVADAVKGQPGRGRIHVSTRLDGDRVLLSVSDSGSGIPEPIRERVFEPFFTTKEVGRGTGQGLAIARSVIAGKHRGEIWFETVVGQGTTFFVRLPLSGAECDSSSPPEFG